MMALYFLNKYGLDNFVFNIDLKEQLSSGLHLYIDTFFSLTFT